LLLAAWKPLFRSQKMLTRKRNAAEVWYVLYLFQT